MGELYQIRVPASSANLGPGFDSVAVALNLHLEIQAAAENSFRISASGRDAEICGSVNNNLILETYCNALEKSSQPIHPLALDVANEIPVGKGCGSSAAARIAGLALADHFGGLGWSDAQILDEAAELEGHPDNVAACWLGGFVVAQSSNLANAPSKVAALQVTAALEIPLILAIPERTFSTEAARQILPEYYSRADIVANLQNSLLMLTSLAQGKVEFLQLALQDRLHEPYRATVCPLLTPLQQLSGKHGIMGAVLSGAGPGVLVFLRPDTSVEEAAAAASRQLASLDLTAEILPVRVEHRGAKGNRTVVAQEAQACGQFE